MNEPTAGPPERGTPRPRQLADHDLDVEILTETATVVHAWPPHFQACGDRTAVLDLLLAEREADPPPAATPTGGRDLGAAMRRIAADVARHQAGRHQPPVWWHDYNRARLGLNSLARSALTGPKAVALLARFAQDKEHCPAPIPVFGADTDTELEIEGARIFGCLLHLAGHPLSAAFWWKIAAGAGDGTACFALYLQHMEHGELDEAEWWFNQRYQTGGDVEHAMPPTVPPMPGYYRTVPTVMAPCHSVENSQPAAGLADEVDRLVVYTDPGDATNIDGIVRRPGPGLATRLGELAGHC